MRLYVLCTFSLGLAACAFEPTGGPGQPDDPGEPDPGVDAGAVVQPPEDPPTPPSEPPPEPPTVTCRVEGSNLGVVGVTVTAFSRTYVFESWQTTVTGLPIGFTLTGPANVRYEVRADDERYMVESLSYSGDERITRVDFCVRFDD